MQRKITCFLFIIIVLRLPLSAQFSKGDRMLGGTIGGAFFNSGKYTYTPLAPVNGNTESTNSLGFNLSPSFGWFISDKTVIGGQITAGYRYDKNLKADEYDVTYYKNTSKRLSFLAGAFARNYFSALGSVLPFGQLSFNVGFGSANNEGFFYSSSPVLYKQTFKGESSGDFVANTGLSLGITKMLNDNIGLDISAGYLYSYNKNSYKTTILTDVDINGTIDETSVSDLTTKYTNHGFTIGVGLQIFLGRKK